MAATPRAFSDTTGSTVQSRSLFTPPVPRDSHNKRIIQKVLIANRGEIACRIISTCRKVGVKSVAVYVKEDASSQHVIDADESILLGSIEQATTNPFLDIELLVKTALSVGAQAIHPGYGYLSENGAFADSVRQAGLIFIGPSSSAMSTLGDKRKSKEYLNKYAPEVPLIPGFAGESQASEELESAAEKIGFPVMLKASAGGGGKGMRIVREMSQLQSELIRAKSEAQRSFGSSDCILEKFIENSKHVEVQIVGDQHGEVISFYERDCSVQRRNQKVIEESPCTYLDDETRKKLSATAVSVVKLLGYEGAGADEFVLDVKTMKFYFLEVNTRLQVEHPITEEVTGVDLVALQLYVAAGGRLQHLPELSNIMQRGHAIECRLCAEDPGADFLPSHGDILCWRPNNEIRDPNYIVRHETAIKTGGNVSIFFDSMICKIVVWAPTRSMAIELMVKELRNTACVGVRTNQLFLQSCLLHPALQTPDYMTSFIPTHLDTLLKNPYSVEIPPYLSVLPSVFLRWRKQRIGQPSKNFRGVRSRFHNQHYDPCNTDSEIITLISKASHRGQNVVNMCLKKPTDLSNVTGAEQIYVRTLSGDDSSIPSDPKEDPITAVTVMYNAASNILRSGEIWSSPSYLAFITSNKPIRDAASPATTPHSFESCPYYAEFSVDGKKITACLVVKNDRATDDSTSVFAHISAIGDWVEFRRDTILSFYNNMRKAAVREQKDKGAGNRTVKAPMPCKVLNMLAKDGSKVEAGAQVMVIESMKMEISIYVQASGILRTSCNVGDAVNEGVTLCSVEEEKDE